MGQTIAARQGDKNDQIAREFGNTEIRTLPQYLWARVRRRPAGTYAAVRIVRQDGRARPLAGG
jgi:hypothetical protein